MAGMPLVGHQGWTPTTCQAHAQCPMAYGSSSSSSNTVAVGPAALLLTTTTTSAVQSPDDTTAASSDQQGGKKQQQQQQAAAAAAKGMRSSSGNAKANSAPNIQQQQPAANRPAKQQSVAASSNGNSSTIPSGSTGKGSSAVAPAVQPGGAAATANGTTGSKAARNEVLANGSIPAWRSSLNPAAAAFGPVSGQRLAVSAGYAPALSSGPDSSSKIIAAAVAASVAGCSSWRAAVWRHVLQLACRLPEQLPEEVLLLVVVAGMWLMHWTCCPQGFWTTSVTRRIMLPVVSQRCQGPHLQRGCSNRTSASGSTSTGGRSRASSSRLVSSASSSNSSNRSRQQPQQEHSAISGSSSRCKAAGSKTSCHNSSNSSSSRQTPLAASALLKSLCHWHLMSPAQPFWWHLHC